ncbi:MAG: elongation factor G [bacterium]|nr:elongation factor G [bacterium]
MPIEDIRNIGLIAHIDAGKTTTTERILYYTDSTYKIGGVDEGTTVMDWMPEERARGITITAASTTCYWKGKQINIIDTPGHIDFTGEVERSLVVLDGVVMIFSAVEGVESQSEAVWYQANKYNVPRIVLINKLDRIGAEPFECIKMITERLNSNVLKMQFPIGIEDKFYSICDILEEKIIEWDKGSDGKEFVVKPIPENLMPEFNKALKELIETIADNDEHIGDLYLENKPISKQELIAAIRRLTIEKQFVPIFFGSSLRNIGVQPLIEGIVNFLPSPLDRNLDHIPDKSKFCGLIFKLYSDAHGTLVYLRIYTGTINAGEYVMDVNSGVKERISQIFLMQGDKRESIKSASAGDIVAIYGPKQVKTGHTLAALDSKIILKSPDFPEPVIFATIKPNTHQDEEKLGMVLQKLVLDDPTLFIKTDTESGELILSGMGELHLEVLLQRMEREFSIKARLSAPQVSYKETITKGASERGEFIKQSGGKGQYGDVELEIKPLERSAGFVFKNKVREGSIPREYFPSIRKGVEDSLKTGVLAGFPVVDVEVTITDGSFHTVDSSDIAFETAASMAVKAAIGKSNPILLEPIMRLEIIAPPEYIGAIIDDLSARGGKILSMAGVGARHNIFASCPMRKLFGYATAIRSATQGRAIYIMKFDSYCELRKDEEIEVLEKLRGY